MTIEWGVLDNRGNYSVGFGDTFLTREEAEQHIDWLVNCRAPSMKHEADLEQARADDGDFVGNMARAAWYGLSGNPQMYPGEVDRTFHVVSRTVTDWIAPDA